MRLRPAWYVTRRTALMSAIFAICLAFSATGAWLLASATMPQRVAPPSQGLHLRLDVVEPGKTIHYEANGSRNNTAFSLLLEAARNEHFSVTWQNWTVPADAVFVTSIDGEVNGQGGRWWQYWVDGAYGSVGADHAALNNGDLVEWRFATYPP